MDQTALERLLEQFASAADTARVKLAYDDEFQTRSRRGPTLAELRAEAKK